MIAIFARKAYNKNNIVMHKECVESGGFYGQFNSKSFAPQKTYGRPASGCRCHHTGTAG